MSRVEFLQSFYSHCQPLYYPLCHPKCYSHALSVDTPMIIPGETSMWTILIPQTITLIFLCVPPLLLSQPLLPPEATPVIKFPR